jgi:predicted amidophosphoribosyltransferase
MSASSVLFSLLIVAFPVLLFYLMRRSQARIVVSGAQRMCPSCGLITSRLKARCLECGKPLSPVAVTGSVDK